MNQPEPIPTQLVTDEARLLHGLNHGSATRDAELAMELSKLNCAVREAANELGFDDQPGDFLALLMSLRETHQS